MKLRNLLAIGAFGLAALVGGCEGRKVKTELQAECNMKNLKVQLIHYGDSENTNYPSKFIRIYDGAKLVLETGKFNKCQDLLIQCDNGTTLRFENCQLYSKPQLPAEKEQ
ncbi:MAG: hypothetical protein KKB39_04485 [Nanoarchaeota archaeon]|nr:hypothetical protein [Nanoarchaeota archaeon]